MCDLNYALQMFDESPSRLVKKNPTVLDIIYLLIWVAFISFIGVLFEGDV